MTPPKPGSTPEPYVYVPPEEPFADSGVQQTVKERYLAAPGGTMGWPFLSSNDKRPEGPSENVAARDADGSMVLTPEGFESEWQRKDVAGKPPKAPFKIKE